MPNEPITMKPGWKDHNLGESYSKMGNIKSIGKA